MATITENYVSFEIAKLLKEKGFEGYTMFSYSTTGTTMCGHWENETDWLPKCTLQMAMKWLREVHNTFISIIYENDGVFVANLKSPLKGVDCMIDDKHNCWFTYEEACEASIKYCLKNLIW